MNRTTIIGHLGDDARLIQFPDGQFLAFSVAVSSKTKEGEKSTTWFSCTSSQTYHHEQLKKGKKVYLEGNVGARTYTNKKEEVKAELYLRVSYIDFVERTSLLENDIVHQTS